MRLLRTSILAVTILILLTTSQVLADSDKINIRSGETVNSVGIEKPHLEAFSIYNPLLEIRNKIKHDKLVAKERAHQKRVKAARRLAKQKAAIKPLVAGIPVTRPAYHASTAGNTYVPGTCVWGVKNWRPDIPNSWGNAYSWFYAAKSSGWATGDTPRIGAVAWLRGGNHVALVISLNPLTIKEVNYNGLYSVHTRTIIANQWGYIY